MYILEKLFSQVLSFFRFNRVMDIYHTKGLDALYSFEGITSVILFLMPIFLVIEIIRSVFILKKGVRAFVVPILIDGFNRIIGRFVSLSAGAYCIALFRPFAPFQTSFTWYWFVYAYIVWELGHFIYHYLSHKVRLFWCLHSTHHTPEEMNMSVSYSHFFLEYAYSDIIRTSISMLLGVNPIMFAMIATIDWIWAEFNHISENTLKDARLGILGNFILTPSHHRVHHSRNDLYLDKNFGNLLNIWDKVFNTYQDELKEVKPEYGITRKINSRSFWQVYFGETIELVKDVYKAKSLKHKLMYIVMPPGWKPTEEIKAEQSQVAEKPVAVGLDNDY